ncbi:hypothetical protein NUU61_006420 [Penicillium alfredii]|uniref:Cupin type-1 domain-containing protein n=1 Tax=Penicillium alfredii TaxID=1506179 RepID=A0A9W9F0Y5_9EURO|nr:uncharacterized protein NUU61_006420 [Penicillium alfredii]KAJ5091550.1 hypothetical protein NUU61_006420 [Penicillium alfredii]
MPVHPVSKIQVSMRQIPKWKRIPNTVIHSKPLMIYHGAFDASAAELSAHLKMVGEVVPQWVNTMYSQTHFHSTTHEILGVVAGGARLCFGAEQNPQRFEPTVHRGDIIIVPTGVGHRLLDDLVEGGEQFKMVGAYPPHKDWDMCYGQPGEEEQVQGIQNVPWFSRDPLYGNNGPILNV